MHSCSDNNICIVILPQKALCVVCSFYTIKPAKKCHKESALISHIIKFYTACELVQCNNNVFLLNYKNFNNTQKLWSILFIHPAIYLFLNHFNYLPICLTNHPSTHLSIHPNTHLFIQIYPSTYPTIHLLSELLILHSVTRHKEQETSEVCQPLTEHNQTQTLTHLFTGPTARL